MRRCSSTIPRKATSAGFHQYDTALPTFSRAEIQANIADLKRFETAVQKFGAARSFGNPSAADRELVLSQIRGQILTPGKYSRMGEESGYLFVVRD